LRQLITIISDLHVGSSLGLCPEAGLPLDDGGVYLPSSAQREVSKAWENFFETAFSFRKISKRILIINGDIVDGAHHNTVALATNNIMTQEDGAVEILKPKAARYDKVFVTRGTEAHVQSGAQSDERIAKGIGAEPDETGNQARWQLWLEVGGMVLNVAHHISTTSSAAYESSAVMREMVAGLVEAGQWGQRMPDVFVRSHRHRFIEVGIPSDRGKIRAFITPAWQLRTPFVERIDRMRLPHIGGVNIIIEDGSCQIKEKIYPFQTTKMTVA
jgi:hypothetical protein